MFPDVDPGPYVCPGCFAVGGAPHSPGCIDAEIERQHEYDRETREMYGDEDPDEGDDIPW